jgi:hypothetical protein
MTEILLKVALNTINLNLKQTCIYAEIVLLFFILIKFVNIYLYNDNKIWH